VSIAIRVEGTDDVAAIRHVHDAAFWRPDGGAHRGRPARDQCPRRPWDWRRRTPGPTRIGWRWDFRAGVRRCAASSASRPPSRC